MTVSGISVIIVIGSGTDISDMGMSDTSETLSPEISATPVPLNDDSVRLVSCSSLILDSETFSDKSDILLAVSCALKVVIPVSSVLPVVSDTAELTVLSAGVVIAVVSFIYFHLLSSWTFYVFYFSLQLSSQALNVPFQAAVLHGVRLLRLQG